ncbi:DUF4328 domain-containing protein [Hyunsoonleella pacifica]|uniref:DUF4328 domain-containing protein n=1 Tax=Hyunsoonleella pacifica TaxID=1080224 RepID=A0A4Q9FSW3_9FLAO|nr:DUF4328 domain-containing protein [Hyunsoonleella pacifica]TBN19067.1 DUF4328 domain-containing protein [Hyunsoonleella pacifica]GGD07050.1 hypothetical protein GCM10011368_06160 [Hyunsoonleella pacifica]
MDIKDNTLRGKQLLIMFAILAVINIISGVFNFYQNNVLTKYIDGEYDDDFIELLDSVSMIVGFMYLICFILTIIFFIRWFRRAYGNLIRLNINMEYEESGAVWGYFIPFVNWVRPIKTMKEIYLKLQDTLKNYDTNFIVNTDTSFIVAWWIVYLLNGLVGNYASRVMNRATDVEGFIEANNIYILSDFIDIISISLAVILVMKISKLELTLKNSDTSLSVIDQIGIKYE